MRFAVSNGKALGKVSCFYLYARPLHFICESRSQFFVSLPIISLLFFEKGDVVREALEAAPGRLVVFVDDDLAEHASVRGALCDDDAAALLRVHFCP